MAQKEKKMDLPKKDSRRYQICVAFANSGTMTLHSVVEEYGLFGFKDKKRVSSELNYLCTTGCLKKLKDAFMPTYELRLAVQSFDKPACRIRNKLLLTFKKFLFRNRMNYSFT